MTFRATLLFSLALCMTACKPKATLTILFDKVDNLQMGGKVYHKGIEIGEVTHFDMVDNKVAVDIVLRDNVRIPVGSTFTNNNVLLGSSSITVDYSDNKQFIGPIDTLTGNFQDHWEDVASDSSKSKRIRQSLEKIGEGVSELVEAVKDTSNQKK